MARATQLGGYRELLAAWRSLEHTLGITPTMIPLEGHTSHLMLCDVGRAGAAASVALCSGVHGDEPAAPWALFSVVRDGLLDARFSYRIWCCTNPSGYALGTRSNADGFDINRSFSRDGKSATSPEARAIERANAGRQFMLSLDLHEDFESDGFYCYEPVVDGAAPLGRHVVRAMDDAGLPVAQLHDAFDLGYPAEARHVRTIERGRVLPDVEAEVRHFAGLPYSMYLLWTHTARRTMTLESARCRPWSERVAMHRVAVVAGLEALAGRVRP